LFSLEQSKINIGDFQQLISPKSTEQEKMWCMAQNCSCLITLCWRV